MSATIEGLEALENFLNQADHLRHRTLQQMSRILTMRQAAKGLLALGEYFQRLRVLNSLWSARPHHMINS
ncbi:transcription factor TGA3 [Tanacetum coccineum]